MLKVIRKSLFCGISGTGISDIKGKLFSACYLYKRHITDIKGKKQQCVIPFIPETYRLYFEATLKQFFPFISETSDSKQLIIFPFISAAKSQKSLENPYFAAFLAQVFPI